MPKEDGELRSNAPRRSAVVVPVFAGSGCAVDAAMSTSACRRSSAVVGDAALAEATAVVPAPTPAPAPRLDDADADAETETDAAITSTNDAGKNPASDGVFSL